MSFHVPGQYRVSDGMMASDANDGNNGAFDLPFGEWRAFVVASDGSGWEHVSVHLYKLGHHGHGKQATPNWTQMCEIKDRFWDDEDVVLQFHPRRSEYVNFHAHTLHLWRPVGVEIPTPAPILVGPRV